MQTRPTTWPSRRSSELQPSEMPTRDYPLAMVLMDAARRSRRRRICLNVFTALTLALALAAAIWEAI